MKANYSKDNLPPQLVQAATFLSEENFSKAEKLLRSYLELNPLDVNAMKLLGDVGLEVRAYREAGYLFTRALDLAPDFHNARFSYAHLLYRRQLPDEAEEQLNIILNTDPDNQSWLALKAVNYALGNKHDKAVELFEYIINKFPANNQIYLSYGHALRALGRIDECIKAYKKAIGFKKGAGEAYWSLANLKTYKFLNEDLNEIQKLLNDKNCNFDDYSHLLFAFGKANEDKNEYQTAFAAYTKGNQVKSKRVPWNSKGFNRQCNELKKFFTKEFFSNNKHAGYECHDPIFVVGLPRSGSTLVEQILSSHSKVEATTELQNIVALSRKIANTDIVNSKSEYPSAIKFMSPDKIQNMGKLYIENTMTQRVLSKEFFIDKMPNNFVHIGLIKLILPNAKIIDIRRNPMDCCFSCYKQLFGTGQGFTYSLRRIGNYYLDYLDIMDHWNKVLPGEIHSIKYEDLIENTEYEIRELLSFCNLDFEKSCLDFYKNKRSVRTPSSEQVRQPIYKSSHLYWKNFEKYLIELKSMFVSNGVSVD